MISLLVRIDLVVALMLTSKRLLPAINGALAIAHRLKWLWFSTSVTGPAPLSLLPTSSMSGSFQWFGPAYGATARLVFTLATIDGHSFFMSVVVRCRLPIVLAHS